jgi:hypothetical protein
VADDPLPAALAGIRAELEAAALAFPAGGLDPARAALAAGTLHGNALKALAAVDAARSFHERVPLYGNAATGEKPGNCPHDPDAACHFEADDGSGEWLCEGRPEGAVCSTCVDGEGGDRADWQCTEYAAILAALTGKGNDGGE